MVTYEGVVMAKELPLTWSPWRNWLARPTVMAGGRFIGRLTVQSCPETNIFEVGTVTPSLLLPLPYVALST